MAVPVVSPRLNFDTYLTHLEAGRIPAGKTAIKWAPDGPLSSIKFLKHFFTQRLANHPVLPITTPRQYAKMLYTYSLTAKVPGMHPGHARIYRNLYDIISILCQNDRANMCTRKTPGPSRIGKMGKYLGKKLAPLYPYLRRDTNPGCSVASAALFANLYGDVGMKIPGINAKNAKTIARNVSIELTAKRQKNPAGVYDSAGCPCLTQALCVASPHCSWIAAPPGGGPGFPGTSSCVPASKTAIGFPGVAGNAGQKFKVAAKAATLRRKGSNYIGYKTFFWRKPNIAVAKLPNVKVGKLAWP